MFEIVNADGVVCGEQYAECHEAAQDAECLHAGSGSRHRVVDTATREVMYETEGGVP